MSSCHDDEIGPGNSTNVSRPVETHSKLLFGESLPTSPELPAPLA